MNNKFTFSGKNGINKANQLDKTTWTLIFKNFKNDVDINNIIHEALINKISEHLALIKVAQSNQKIMNRLSKIINIFK